MRLLSSAAAGAVPHCWHPCPGPRSPAQSRPRGGPEARPYLSMLPSFLKVGTGRAKVTCATPATDLPAALGQGLRSRQAQQAPAYHGDVICPASRRWRGARVCSDLQCTPRCCGPHAQLSTLCQRVRTDRDVASPGGAGQHLPARTCRAQPGPGLNCAADRSRPKEEAQFSHRR